MRSSGPSPWRVEGNYAVLEPHSKKSFLADVEYSALHNRKDLHLEKKAATLSILLQGATRRS
jgi:hypothetical protein